MKISLGKNRVQNALARLLVGIPDSLFEKILFFLPSSRRKLARHKRAKARFRWYVRQKIGAFMVEVEPGPVGPEEIILKTAVLSRANAPRQRDADVYFENAYRQLLDWLQLLERFSFNLRTLGSVLELGCGSARLIRHFRCIEGIRLVGTDLVPEHVKWCQQNIPGVEFYVNDPTPPLKFAADSSFDLAYAASVFTHIPIETRDLWIQEMNRILRPGGFLLCDVLGRYHQRQMLGKDDLEQLRKRGHFTLPASNPKASLSTQLVGSWDVFMTRAEALKAFGLNFRVLDFLPYTLNLLVLQKLP
ncbi:MAG TPA: class I SAM-dependent methyltransferase [Verrucomicrobiae bacterium]|nr:class I SAM-dependent methyltransferase [Verrucomicrobiae bacterium]